MSGALDASGQVGLYGSLLLAGLAGSLHCAGMCGPILLSFAQAFGRGARGSGAWRADFVWYHAGRLWTYAILGFLGGLAGKHLRDAAALLGWQRAFSVVIAVAVALAGVLLLGIVPRLSPGRLVSACAIERFHGRAWLSALLASPGALPRFLLGALMGLLPCGLVWSMLVVVAALPTPLHAAAGMLAFGAGTLPSLSAVLLAGQLFPRALRVHGTRVAAMLLVATACWMVARALIVQPGDAGHCASRLAQQAQ